MIFLQNIKKNFNNYGVIGYEFIYAQQSFWLANLGSFVIIFITIYICQLGHFVYT